MSTLWTPSGERPVNRPGPEVPPSVTGQEDGDPAEQLEALRRQIAETPPEVVIANHCYGIFELAAIYLSQDPPMLGEAQLAIDALGFLVEGLGERLGEVRASLDDALSQVRLAFVRLNEAVAAREEAEASANGGTPA